MKIGLVLHGPEVIDTGKAAALIEYLGKRGEVEARLGGTMGAAAIMDAGLENKIEIRRELVSDALRDMARYSDVLYLASCGKTEKSGLAFGRIAVGRAAIRPVRPLVQIDDGFVVAWNDEGRQIAEEDARALDHQLIDCSQSHEKNDEGWRRVHGIKVGENVWINGVVVGKAVTEDVWVGSEKGALVLRGIEIKQHGLDKLGSIDPYQAVIRSGSVRRTSGKSRMGRQEAGSKIVFVDHGAESSFFRAKGAKAAVTVGDDTTCISGSLLYRLGVPIVGIVDGDEDGICMERAAYPGSVVIVLDSGNDDIVGSLIKKELFVGKDEIEFQQDVSQLAERIIGLCGNKIKKIRRF